VKSLDIMRPEHISEPLKRLEEYLIIQRAKAISEGYDPNEESEDYDDIELQ